MNQQTGMTTRRQIKDSRQSRQQCHIAGGWQAADSGSTIIVSNPATGEGFGTVPKMSAAKTRRAIDAANAAWTNWRSRAAKERASLLRRRYDLIMENQEDLAVLMTLEQGKPLAESRGEVAYGASFVEWFAEEAKRVYGDTIPQHQPDKRIVVVKEPTGVVASITPWNFPIAMITRKCAPALAAGCPVVAKPARQTPYSALALAEIADRAGLPAGVFNVIAGSAAEIRGAQTSSPIVRKHGFTGSTEIGKRLMRDCAGTVEKVSLELGGMRRSWFSTTRIWTRPWKAPSRRSIAT
jgi:NAD-dependent aldehyde dehydrogenases